MADFQSSKTAAEIEEVLTGAVLFNTNTKLSEAQKAQARANIGATANGEGIKIISHFDTLEELEAAVKAPNAGDAYSVGTALPYNLFIYDYLSSIWRDYGAIRSTDISARFAQNVTVAVDDWEEDTDVFADYTFKAQIPIGEVTGNDFPIVAFSPPDAIGGNFCPIAYCFDGYVEIWARTIPSGMITVPAITFIIQDDGASVSTKGITNAGGGFPEGGVTNAMLASNSVGTSKIMNGSVTRAKLAQDALYSPIASTLASTQTRAITAADVGKTLLFSWVTGEATMDTTFTLSLEDSYNIPAGAEIAIYYMHGKSCKIAFSGGVNIDMCGEGRKLNPTLAIPEKYGMIALKKILHKSGGSAQDYWLVTGNVEVVL